MTFLCQLGCHSSAADTSDFTYVDKQNILYILVYVDDIIITGSSSTLVSAWIAPIASCFSLKDPTYLDYFLGIKVTRTRQGLHLMYRKYVIDLFTKMNMHDVNPISTPLVTTPKLTLHSGYALDNLQENKMVNGSLQYWHSQDPILHTMSTDCLSSCINQHMNTRRPRNAYFGICLALFLMVSTSTSSCHTHFMLTQKLIGPVTQTIMSPQILISFTRVPLLLLGRLANKQVLRGFLQRQRIGQ